MSQMFVACTNCGDPLPVDAEALKTAIALGDEFTATHDRCPGAPPEDSEAPPVERRFRIQLLMFEILDDTEPDWVVDIPGAEPMGGTGTTVSGRNFAEAVNGPITTWLNRTWPTVQEHSAFADLPPATPTTSG